MPPLMFASRSPFTKWLAAGLPVCFLWVLISCASLCSEHAAEASRTRTNPPAAGRYAAQVSEDWHCPFAGAASQGALPQRRSFAPSQSTSLVAPCEPTQQPTSFITSRRVNSSGPPAYADPPFESLRTLRI
jgi:hypothetical protein